MLKMLRDKKLLIKDIISEIDYIKDLTNNIDYNIFKSNKTTKRAVLFSLVVIGEACNTLQKKYKYKMDELLFYFKKNRNELAHRYWLEVSEIQWDLIKNKLPILEKQIKKEEEN